MKIIIDRDKCIGAATCIVLASKTFGLDQDGKAFILNENKETAVMSPEGTVVESEATEAMDARESIMEGARSCPVLAIKLFEDDGTEIIL